VWFRVERSELRYPESAPFRLHDAVILDVSPQRASEIWAADRAG
jgi:hypothetical protein